MDNDILHDLSPLIRIYKDGRIERLGEAGYIPPWLDLQTGVESKDINIFHGGVCVKVRIFKPNMVKQRKVKVPIMVYFHGGGFCIESTFSPLYHNYLNSLSSQAQTLVVSVEYRLAPEHPLPAAYDDSWFALNWVASHADSNSFDSSNGEPWIRDYADFSRVFLGGDSAGGNITHHMALRVGKQGLANGSIFQINGIILFHPFFWGKDRMGGEVTKLNNELNPVLADKLWAVVCPGSSGPDDPWVNPVHDTRMSKLGCERVVVFVAEKDFLRDRGFYYKDVLEKSGWQGKVEVVESYGEDHVFFLFNPSCANAVDVMRKVVHFINPDLVDTTET